MSDKIFIIGLPRTGTTSICSKFLDLGYKVAHTAYTQKTFEHAQVIADTPTFADYQQLHNYYPNSKFIYLNRRLSLWVPSIRQLLLRMHKNVIRDDGGFNPIIKRCYQQTFSPFSIEKINNDQFLKDCYEQHRESVYHFFADKQKQLLTIDISKDESLSDLLSFLSLPPQSGGFNKMNIGGKVTAWKDLAHSNKIESTKNGRISTLEYLHLKQ